MKKPFIIGVIVFVAILAIGYGVVVSNLSGPKVEGKRVVVWTEELASRDGAVREKAKQSLQSNVKEFLPHLAGMMNAKDSEERQKWSTVLKVEYVPAYGLRLSANRAISFLGASAAPIIPQLIPLLGDKDAGLDTAGALASIGKDAIPALTESFKSSDAQVRAMAAAAFARMKTGEGVSASDALMKGLQDPDGNTRSWMAKAVGKAQVNPEMAIPALIALLDDKDTGVVANSASALGSYGAKSKEALPILQKLAKSRNEEISGAAQGALLQINASTEDAAPAAEKSAEAK
ncbi:MAG TPA: HEAT repeat domain-containing protein [Verrucomicrobiae bacterium]